MKRIIHYEYSSVVDPSTYETHGLCEGIPLRCHHSPELEEIETLRCQEDWRKWVGPLGMYKGGLGPRWNFMAITVPECLPERLGVLGYANELAFLHDDITDVVSVGDAHNDDLRLAFEQGAETGIIPSANSGKRAIQAHIAQEMMALHKEQAIVTMRAWAKFAELGSGRHHDTRFETEAEYIRYRMIDIGTMFWYGMVTFGMGISIPEEELDLAHELANVAYLNLGLTNDLYSYQKEYDTAMAMGQDYVVNIIWVLMVEHKISEAESKDICREKIKQTIVDFRKIVDDTNVRTDVSVETKRYLEGLLYSLSGNLVWSIDCPRYHSWSSYNKRQLDWMKNGIPRGETAAMQNGGPVHHDSCHVSAKKNGTTKEDTPMGGTPEPSNGHHMPRNGLPGTSLVNIFATEEIKSLKAMRILGENGGAPTKEPWQNGVHYTNGSAPKKEKTELDITVIEAPYQYLSSLPSKGVRETLIDCLNVWFRVPAQTLDRIKRITKLLHNASLMLDDLEDGSPLRRGSPSTHTIFGAGQTVNAANFHILRALEEVHSLGDVESLVVFTEELRNLYVGQSLDLYWTRNQLCPSVEQYFKMVESKTGGLFRLFGRLMGVHSSHDAKVDMTELLDDFGRFFQTRDDYQNLISSDYAEHKGFCEDLDEGKYSLPLIHLMSTTQSNHLLRNILSQRHINNGSSRAHKQVILALMEKSGSLTFAEDILSALHAKAVVKTGELERKFGIDNPELTLLLKKLEV